MMKSAFVFASIAALVGLVHAQGTCPCDFSPEIPTDVVVPVTIGEPSTCRIEQRIAGGCYCVSGVGNAGICEIDSEALRWQFIDEAECELVPSPVAICPTTDSLTFDCYEDRNVAWTKDCIIPFDLFPPTGVQFATLTVLITQTDNVTFTGNGTAGAPYTVTYETINNYLPPNAFTTPWPNTPEKEDSGVIPPTGTVNWFDASVAPPVTL
eukprot:CAMPEP_0185845832 /NCGR_PEP_ID=MMETSP1354-20130828/1691_1 /TAXON_ID=708628 /ORGANISM="Erythrolobus madagascarensis, Strain CCMP3276" /LENGTH=209 /DNA_ID=CAMNT_0028545889 /DNA_START=271 /DNA_END=897 /DNA_ORIENTATION=+